MIPNLSGPCPTCENNDFTKKELVEEVGEVCRILCKACKTIYFDRPAPIAPTYDIDYNLHFFRLGDIRKAGIMAMKIAEIANYYYEKPQILEAGTGNGLTVFLLRSAGINACGLDIDQRLCNYLWERFKIPVGAGTFEDLKETIQYDLIYSSHVIEHCTDPIKFVKKAFDLLKPGGLFFLDTPDTRFFKTEKNRWHHFATRNQYEHCTLLGFPGIKILAEKAGLTLPYLSFKAPFMSMQALFLKGQLNPPRTEDLPHRNEYLAHLTTYQKRLWGGKGL